MTGNFDGLPLVLGSVRGKRVWSLNRKAQLRSPMHGNWIWKGRENVAECGTSNGTGVERVALCDFVREEIFGPIKGLIVFEGLYKNSPDTWTVSWIAAARDRKTIQQAAPSLFINGAEPYSHMFKDYTCIGDILVPVESFRDRFNTMIDGRTHMEYCECGFYAYYANEEHQYSGQVAGVIEGYGETLVGTKGFRTAKARILALTPYDFSQRSPNSTPSYITNGSNVWNFDRLCRKLRRRYKGVEVFRTVSEMYEAFPPTTAEEAGA